MKTSLLFVVLVLCFSCHCWAEVPETLSYQGILRNEDGTPIEDGAYEITFSLYNTASGSSPLWTEEKQIDVENGIINTLLGSVNELDLPFDELYWLGISVAGNDELAPRIQLTSSAYSLNAKSVSDGAVTSEKIPDETVVRSINGITDNVEVTGDGDIEVTEDGNTITVSSNYEGGIALPFSATVSSTSPAFLVYNEGDGLAAEFRTTNGNSDANTLMAVSECDYSTLNIGNHGNGSAGYFSTSYDNDSTVLNSSAWGNGWAGRFIGWGDESCGIQTISPNVSLSAISDGSTNTIESQATGSGWAGAFFAQGNSHGVYISAPLGNTGLNVGGGTKNAIVATSQGARKLYTEESSEVWFTDYGFGTLTGGAVVINIDPLYAETVNLSESYHVFVQPYGDASLYVEDRNPSKFVVASSDVTEEIEFSYRIVAKRKGYENNRLEHEPMGDEDPNLYPGANKRYETGRFDADMMKYRQNFKREQERHMNKLGE